MAEQNEQRRVANNGMVKLMSAVVLAALAGLGGGRYLVPNNAAGDNMRERVTRCEAATEALSEDIAEVKTGLREVRGDVREILRLMRRAPEP